MPVERFAPHKKRMISLEARESLVQKAFETIKQVRFAQTSSPAVSTRDIQARG